MKKILLSLAMLLTGVGAWAQETTLTNGSYVSFVNVQNVNGTATEKYYLYVDANKNLSIGTMNADIMDPETMFFKVEVRENSKYSFYNEATNTYMIWRGKSNGYNSDKGTMDTYEATYCDWAIGDGSGSGVSDTYILSGKRGTQDQFVSLVILDDGVFDAYGTGVGYSNNAYSNLFKIEEVEDVKGMYATAIAEVIDYVNNSNSFGQEVGQYIMTEEIQVAVFTASWLTDQSTIEQYENAYTDLMDKVASAEFNTPQIGKFYRLQNDVSNNYMSDDGTKFVVMTDGASAASTIFYLGENNTLLSYTSGRYLDCNEKGYASIGTSYNGEFGVAYAGAKANVITYMNNGQWTFGNRDNGVQIDRGSPSPNQTGYNWRVLEVTSLPVTIGETGYASFFAPVAVTLPEGEDLKAYYVSTADETKATMVEVEDGVIPANTGVILQGTESTTYDLTIGGEGTVEGNKLTGTVASSYVNASSYVLAKPESGSVGFYLAELNKNSSGATVETDGTHFLNNGFKAYLPVANLTTSSGARFLLFDFGTETGIDCIESVEATKDAVVYDLAGRRVQGAQKGLYIVNGKVVIK